MFRQILGPSPTLDVRKKVRSHLFFHWGNATDTHFSEQEFFQVILDNNSNSLRLTNRQITEILSNKGKKLTKDQRLVKSIIEQTQVSRLISENRFKNVEENIKIIFE